MYPVTQPGRFLGVIVFFFLVSVLPFEGSAQEYEYDLFNRARNAFDAGEYKEAVTRFKTLLKRDVKNQALRLECHKFLGVAYLFIDDKEMAKHHFSELLTIDPNYSVDPLMFPIEVVDFFHDVKRKSKSRLRALAQARAKEEMRRKAEQEKRQKAEFEKLRRNVYYERRRKTNSLLVAFMPFGAGQFQNGDIVKGSLFLSGEAILGITSVVTYFLHENLRKQADKPFASSAKLAQTERRETSLRITNQASVVAFGALAIIGIIDALYGYEKETVTWKRVKERNVPEDVKPGGNNHKVNASIAPRIDTGMIGLELIGRF